jgi:hypothetical protein
MSCVQSFADKTPFTAVRTSFLPAQGVRIWWSWGYNASGKRSPDDQARAERLIRNLGRPVLILSPKADVADPSVRIAIGWSEIREFTRAAHEAVELANPGANINLIALLAHAGDEKPGADSRDDLAAAFDKRGYKVTTTNRLAIRALHPQIGMVADVHSARFCSAS